MAISKVPDLPSDIAIVDPQTGYPTLNFQRWWQSSVEAGINTLITSANLAAATAAAQQAAVTATAAAQTATTAAATAQTTAATATTAAATATAAAAAQARETALVNSTITPTKVLTSDPTTIRIAAHTRNYGDGTSVAVNAGTAAATGSGVTDYVSYSDPARAGGAVSYIVSETAPGQTGAIHVIGAVRVPVSGGFISGGDGPRPGLVLP